MYKYIFFLFIVVISFNAKVQGNLQFNQVSIFDVYSSNRLNIAHIVPAGKVCKIEAVTSSTASDWIYLNGITHSNSPSSTPFWLPSAFTDIFTSTNSASGKISIIEFNNIP